MDTKDKQLKEPFGGSIAIAPGAPSYALEKAMDHVPEHYILDGLGVESIDVIRAVLGPEGFQAFCHGCALKYLIRCRKKGGVGDLRKAQDFITWMIESMEDLDGENKG